MTYEEWRELQQRKHDAAYQRLKEKLESRGSIETLPSLLDGTDGGPHRKRIMPPPKETGERNSE